MNGTVIAKVKAMGFAVYMRNPGDTWLYFTDGVRLGYLQEERYGGFSLSTVHKPNHTTGTGYNVERDAPDFDKAMLLRCFQHAPSWAHGSDPATVVKFASVAQWLASSAFTCEYKEV